VNVNVNVNSDRRRALGTADRETVERRIQERLSGSAIFMKAVRDLRRMASNSSPVEVAVNL